jgi:hypothetical protein
MTASCTGADDLPARTLQSDAKAGPEGLLDLGIELTFPASDPIAVQDAFGAARGCQQSQQSEQQETYP